MESVLLDPQPSLAATPRFWISAWRSSSRIKQNRSGALFTRRADADDDRFETGQVHELRGSKTLAYPEVSPDGRYVATVTEDVKKLRIYDFSSQTWQEFAPASGAGTPAGSSDSRYVYFDNGVSTVPAVYRTRVADQNRWNNLPPEEYPSRHLGQSARFGLSPKHDPLVLRDAGTQEAGF